MKLRALTGAALAGVLAACGDMGGGADQSRSNVTKIRVPNRHHEQLLALDERYRRVGLLRAIRDSRNRCRSVVGGTYQQQYEGLAMWVARCEDNRQWAVYIAPSGQVQVRNCSEAQQLGLPLCRPFEPAPMEELQRVPGAQDK